jgi:hypothetical protein
MSIVADQRTPGWFWLHDRIIDTYGRELGPIGIAVYACLARHADKAGESFPAKNTIATEIGASKRAVDTAIARLAHFKLITVTKRKAALGGYDSSVYTLANLTEITPKPPTEEIRPKYSETTRQHDRARKKVQEAIKKGKLARPCACSKCGGTTLPIEAHHTDYTKRLDVIWLCTACHVQTHTKKAS